MIGTGWVATNAQGRVLHLSKHDGWTLEIVTGDIPREAQEGRAVPVARQFYRHIKSDGVYELLFSALREYDRKPMTIYRSCADGQVWVRPTLEFSGKFTPIAAPCEAQDQRAAGQTVTSQREPSQASNSATTDTVTGRRDGHQQNESAHLIERLRDAGLPERGARDHRLLREAADRIAALERELDDRAEEFRKVEKLWKEASIYGSRMYDTIGGLENACRISISRADKAERERNAANTQSDIDQEWGQAMELRAEKAERALPAQEDGLVRRVRDLYEPAREFLTAKWATDADEGWSALNSLILDLREKETVALGLWNGAETRAETIERMRGMWQKQCHIAVARAEVAERELAAARECVADLVGLFQLINQREDMPDDILLAVRSNHRLRDAETFLAARQQEKP